MYNKITDVPGITVGHYTLQTDNHNTGITIIKPKQELVNFKMLAATHVINGYGKSIGTIQVEELGEIESAIVLTNTLAAGRVCDYLTHYTIDIHHQQAQALPTFNPLVFECNDSFLNDIEDNPLTYENFICAINSCEQSFATGSVGAGTGMSCHQLKGGIGSSSQTVTIGDKNYTIGCLVLTNYGLLEDLMWENKPLGKDLVNSVPHVTEIDKGSAIVIIATDIPLSQNQLKRLSKRAVVGLSKSGSIIAHGSGEVVLSFSTANQQANNDALQNFAFINDTHINQVFRSGIEIVADAVNNSMLSATTTTYKNNTRISLKELLK